MRNAKRCVFPAGRTKCAYLCTKSASKGVFGYLVPVCHNFFWCCAPLHLCTKSASKNVFGYLVHLLHKTCQQKHLWILSLGVLVLHIVRKKLLVWHAEYTYPCPQSVNKSVFGYLVCVCLKCTMPKKCCSGVARRMRIPVHQKLQSNYLGVFEMHNAKKKCVFDVAHCTQLPAHQKVPTRVSLEA